MNAATKNEMSSTKIVNVTIQHDDRLWCRNGSRVWFIQVFQWSSFGPLTPRYSWQMVENDQVPTEVRQIV